MSRFVIDRALFLTSGNDRKREDVSLPEFGEGAVIPVWGMTARERSVFEKSFVGKSGQTIDGRVQEFRERLVVACCRNDDGSQIFTAEDVSALGAKNADIVERIVNVCQRLSGMTKEDVEETAKNSGPTQVG
jgi:hypothetical protein